MENEEFLHRHKVIRCFRKYFLQIAKTAFFRISSVSQGFIQLSVYKDISIFKFYQTGEIFASFNFGHFYQLIDFSTMFVQLLPNLFSVIDSSFSFFSLSFLSNNFKIQHYKHSQNESIKIHKKELKIIKQKSNIFFFLSPHINVRENFSQPR